MEVCMFVVGGFVVIWGLVFVIYRINDNYGEIKVLTSTYDRIGCDSREMARRYNSLDRELKMLRRDNLIKKLEGPIAEIEKLTGTTHHIDPHMYKNVVVFRKNKKSELQIHLDRIEVELKKLKLVCCKKSGGKKK